MRIALAGILAIAVVGAVDGQAQTRRVYAGAMPIPALVQPGDSELVVESRTSPPLTVAAPPGVPFIEWLIEQSDLVVIARVLERRSALVQQETWVQTRVVATIEQTLNDSSGAVTPGERFTFLEDGGDIEIGPTRILASVPWKDSTVVGERYLLFAERGPDGGMSVVPESTYHLGRSVITKLLKSPADDPVAGLSEQEVLAAIRAYRNRRPR